MLRSPSGLRSSFFLLALIAAALAPRVHADDSRLANLSTRAQVGTGGDIMITGFVVGPGPNKTVLIRAIGPTLTSFNLTGALADPTLGLFNSSGTLLNTNNDWLAADAATMTSVGAFPLVVGTKDAALVQTLAPGAYTAQVSGTNNTTGLALLEVYEVGATATSSRLLNISTRALVGTGATVMIPGIVIGPGSGTRKLLVRAAGPALTALGVPGALADPTITIVSSAGATVATNNDWSTPVGAASADAVLLTSAYTQAGAFAFPANSKDAAVLADFAPGGYTVQVSGVGNSTGVALVEVYDVSPSGPPTVTVAASKASADESGANGGEFTITRSGDTLSALTVKYGMSGTAINAFDYSNLAGTVAIPVGASSVKISLVPLPDTESEATETATLTLAADPSYTVGSAASASVSIANSVGTLYTAVLRPSGSATNSTASGFASIVLSASGTVASVTVTFTNLSSSQAGAHLFLGNSTNAADYVLNLPIGQVAGTTWNLNATSTYTSAQVLSALQSGQIFVGLDTGNYPAGELRGAFIQSAGSQVFTAPASAPAVSLTNAAAADAARLLTQATFGPKKTEIDALTGGSLDAWITSQMSIPTTSLRAAELAEFEAQKSDEIAAAALVGRAVDLPDNFSQFKHNAWFKIAVTAPDQLRQRVAFALSQIFVVSDVALGQAFTEPICNYYDLLANGAFGNFRTVLEQVSLSPVMGNYLSSVRNAKADPVAGTSPDENYAREVMQLFTIGLVQLQPDGTLKLDSAGLPIPTYNNTTITQMAKVFTGWAYFSTRANPSFRTERPDYINPMMLYPAFHDDTAKAIVNNVTIPANQGGTQDLKLALDALFFHPNCAPFISKQLIQRLVTSNPSPAYVYRVAQKFENNGSGVRGDLGAVVRAILTDYEARSTAVIANAGTGKLKEPLLRYTALLRSFNATAANGRYKISDADTNLLQDALSAPSVFNFFEPAYVQPGTLAAAGLYAPEFQITNATTAITVPNYFRRQIFNTAGLLPGNIVLNIGTEQSLVPTVSALLDHLSLVQTAGQLSAATRTRITTALGSLSASTTALERAQTAILLIATSPDGALQK